MNTRENHPVCNIVWIVLKIMRKQRERMHKQNHVWQDLMIVAMFTEHTNLLCCQDRV